MKKYVLSTIGIFVVWQILDFLFHGKILMAEYAATAQLWRPMAEMKTTGMMGVSLVSAFLFTYIYDRFVAAKSVATGVQFGLFWGIAAGVSMGAGTYCYMPITCKIATVWFIATVVSFTAAGSIAGRFCND